MFTRGPVHGCPSAAAGCGRRWWRIAVPPATMAAGDAARASRLVYVRASRHGEATIAAILTVKAAALITMASYTCTHLRIAWVWLRCGGLIWTLSTARRWSSRIASCPITPCVPSIQTGPCCSTYPLGSYPRIRTWCMIRESTTTATSWLHWRRGTPSSKLHGGPIVLGISSSLLVIREHASGHAGQST